MHILVLGATGRVGLNFVKQAAARGHVLTALGRSDGALRGLPITSKLGDVTDSAVIGAALAGQDAVFSTLGPVAGGPKDLLERAARATVAAMERSPVKRLVVVSAAMLFPGVLTAIVRFFLKDAARDSTAMEAVVEASALQFTILRPPRLTDGAPRGRYRERERALPPFAMSMDRADVAQLACDVLERNTYSRSMVGASK